MTINFYFYCLEDLALGYHKLLLLNSESLSQQLEDSIVHCPNQDCTMTAHTICLAKAFINKKNEDGIFCLPLDGRCPSCQTCFLWRDFVKPSETLQLDNNLICDDDKPHWTQTLRQT